MLFQPRQPTMLSVRVSSSTDWMQMGSLRRLSGPQALQIWTHCDYHIWGTMLQKYHKLQPKHKTTDELKVALQTIWEEMPRERWRSSPSVWLPTWLWLPVVVTLSICSNSVCLQFCILIWSPNKLALCRDTNRLPVNIMLGMLRNGERGVLSWFK